MQSLLNIDEIATVCKNLRYDAEKKQVDKYVKRTHDEFFPEYDGRWEAETLEVSQFWAGS